VEGDGRFKCVCARRGEVVKVWGDGRGDRLAYIH
jgi:hypothetical protein